MFPLDSDQLTCIYIALAYLAGLATMFASVFTFLYLIDRNEDPETDTDQLKPNQELDSDLRHIDDALAQYDYGNTYPPQK